MKTKKNMKFIVLIVIISMVLGNMMISSQPVSAAPAISFIGNIGSKCIEDTDDTTMVFNPSVAVAAGDTIIITTAGDQVQTYEAGVTDSKSNTYYLVASSVLVGTGRAQIFAAYNVTALTTSDTITITHSALNITDSLGAFCAVVSVFRGLAQVGAFDQNHIGYALTTTAPTSGNITTTQADELLIGVIGTEGWVGDAAGSWGATWANSETRIGTGSSSGDTHFTLSMNYQVVSSTGTYAASKSGITSADAASAIVAFKPTCTGICYIGDIGYAQLDSSGTTLPITTKGPVAAGDDIIISFAMDGATGTVSAADSSSNTYSVVANAQFGTPSNSNVRTVILDSHAATALAKGSTITITHPSVTARSAVVSVFRGLEVSPAVDQTKTSTGTTADPDYIATSGATATTTQADELVFGAIGTEGANNSLSGVWGNSFNTTDRRGTYSTTLADNIAVASGWRIIKATGAYTASITGIGSAQTPPPTTGLDYAAAVATLKMSAAAQSYLGDVNGDDVVNSTDALIILSGDVGISVVQYCPVYCGDVNADGIVNSTDGLIVLSYNVGITVPFPVGQAGACPVTAPTCNGCNP